MNTTDVGRVQAQAILIVNVAGLNPVVRVGFPIEYHVGQTAEHHGGALLNPDS
jgi:hypothetical protein